MKFTDSSTKSSREQLMNLFRDLRLKSYEQKVWMLEYLWQGSGEGVLGQGEFISGVVRTNGVYRGWDKRREEDKLFVEELSKMGFVKN